MQAISSTWDRAKHGPAHQHRRPPTDNKRRLQLLVSYAPDWIFTLVLLLVIGILTDKAGYKREFSLTDTSIQHTYAQDQRISFAECIAYAGIVPGVIMFIWAVAWRRSVWDWHNSWLGLVLSCSITTVITQCVKVAVGRPRPDLINRCQPIADAANLVPYGLATMQRVCTVTTGHIIDDGFKSFPSGHASFAFAGLTFLSLYMSGKMHLLDRRGFAIKSWLVAAPLLGAALIAVSRTMDYRHHATDVIAGGLLGFTVSLIVYHLYYPPLTSPSCHLPFSPRIPRAEESHTLSELAQSPSVPAPTGGSNRQAQRPIDDGIERDQIMGDTARRPNGGGVSMSGGGGPGYYGRLVSQDGHSHKEGGGGGGDLAGTLSLSDDEHGGALAGDASQHHQHAYYDSPGGRYGQNTNGTTAPVTRGADMV